MERQAHQHVIKVNADFTRRRAHDRYLGEKVVVLRGGNARQRLHRADRSLASTVDASLSSAAFRVSWPRGPPPTTLTTFPRTSPACALDGTKTTNTIRTKTAKHAFIV